MQILPPKSSQTGSVLLVSLMVTAILGLTLASYLLMAQQQNLSVMRSQTWNSAIVLSEAGVEDALAMLNKFNSQFDQLTNWATSASLNSDNWAALGNNTYHARRFLGDDYYDVYVTNINNTPVISSKGYTRWYYNGGSSFQQTYASVALNQSTAPVMVARKVNVGTRTDPLFNVAMAAIEQIDFAGKNVQTDSFDSCNSLYNDGGLYPYNYPDRQLANGDVVTDLAILDSLNVGNAKIKGQAKTGPTGTMKVLANGSVGDKAWVEGGNKGVQPGHFADDMNVLFPKVEWPGGSLQWVHSYPSGTNINGKTYYYMIPGDGDWIIADLTKAMYIAGKVNVVVYNKLQLTGANDEIYIAPGSQVRMYVGWNVGDATIAGNGIINASGNANDFWLLGMPDLQKLAFAGNASFAGVIYAPQTALTLGGGGNNVIDFVGCSVSKSVKMNGHYNFHYDECLRNQGPPRGYIPTSWKEM